MACIYFILKMCMRLIGRHHAHAGADWLAYAVAMQPLLTFSPNNLTLIKKNSSLGSLIGLTLFFLQHTCAANIGKKTSIVVNSQCITRLHCSDSLLVGCQIVRDIAVGCRLCSTSTSIQSPNGDWSLVYFQFSNYSGPWIIHVHVGVG